MRAFADQVGAPYQQHKREITDRYKEDVMIDCEAEHAEEDETDADTDALQTGLVISRGLGRDERGDPIGLSRRQPVAHHGQGPDRIQDSCYQRAVSRLLIRRYHLFKKIGIPLCKTPTQSYPHRKSDHKNGRYAEDVGIWRGIV